MPCVDNAGHFNFNPHGPDNFHPFLFFFLSLSAPPSFFHKQCIRALRLRNYVDTFLGRASRPEKDGDDSHPFHNRCRF